MIRGLQRRAVSFRWAFLFSLVLAAATAVPVFAAQPAEGPKGAEGAGEALTVSQIPAPTDAEIAEAEHARREHDEWLAGPDAVRQREASQSAFSGITAGESRGLLVESFPAQLQELNADPARVISSLEVERPLGERAARVVNERGERAILESSVPVQSELGGEGKEPVDLTLEGSGQAFTPANPLSKVSLPGSAEEAIRLEGGVSVQLPTSDDHPAQPLGEENLFYPETEAATDTLVSPIAAGVEVSEQLRSSESPEQLSFALGLPAGASLRETGEGGAEVVSSSGQAITEVPPPSAVDAQGAEVPVAMSVQGDSLLLEVPHRGAEFAYPILVDPQYINYNAYINESTNFTPSVWSEGQTSGEYVLRDFGSSLNAYSRGSGAYFGPGTYAQFGYSAPGETAWIAAATFSNISFYPIGSCRKDQPHGYVGLYNPGRGAYDSLGVYSGGEVTGSTFETGWIGNTGTRWAIFGIGTGSEGLSMNCVHEIWVGGYSIQERDWEAPTLSVSGVPGGWFDSTNASPVAITAWDRGFGVHEISVGESGGVTSHDPLGCSGVAGSRCPPSEPWTVPVAYKQGERTLTVTAEDPMGNVDEWTATTKVDLQKPEIELHGELARATEEVGTEAEAAENPARENQLTFPVYNLQVKARDGGQAASERQSGVTRLEVLLDGENTPLAQWQEACAQGYSCSHEMPVQVKLNGLSAGPHHLHILATDGVGHVREREINFEYFPATGEDSEYVMQRFPLGEEEGEQGQGPELAVNVMNGNLVYHEQDLSLNTPSAEVELERFYNSELPEEASSDLGTGWTLAQTPTLKPEEGAEAGGTALAGGTDGAMTNAVQMPAEPEEEVFEPKLHATITDSAGGGYEMTEESGRTTSYNPEGLPTEVKTGEFSAIKYGWEGEELSEIAVEDPAATDSSPEEVEEREGGQTEGRPEYQSSFGARGDEAGQFVGPGGMALDSSGNLWVADRGNDRVEEFGKNGEYLRQVGSAGTGDGKLRDPAAVAVDGSGDLWVADSGNDRVEEFGPEGEYLGRFGGSGTGEGQFSGAGPQGIALDSGGDVLVTDAGGHRIEKFDSGGKFLEAFGAAQLSEPSGLAVGPAGRIWVADAAADKIVAFKEGGQFLRSFGEEGEAEGKLKGPAAVAVNSEGQVFVADTGNGRVQEFSEGGAFLHEFGSREGVKGRFSAPMGLAADGEGDVWVAAVANAPEPAGEGEGEEEAEPAEEESPREGLIASYSFDESAGKTAHDDSGHGHDGGIEGGEWAPGKFGGALRLGGGAEECVTVPDSPELALTEEFTLSAWIKPEGEDDSEPVIFKESGWYFTYALFPGAFHEGMHPEGAGAYYPYSANEVAGPAELPTGAWSNVALTYGEEELRLYVDGQLVGSGESWGVISSDEPLRIGCAPKWEDGFTGKIDNVRLYDRALSAAELAEDEETAVAPLAAKGPVASYSLDEGAGKTARDDTGDGHEGAIEGGEWTEGKYGSALKLSGESEDCISVADSPQLQLTHEFTLSAWVRPEGGDQSGPIYFKEAEHFVSYAMYLGFSEEGKPAGVIAPHPYEAVSVEGSSTLPQDAWSQLTLTYDTEKLRLYVDGNLVSSEAISGPVESEKPLRIGCSRDWEEGFTGKIDNARIYDRALGSAEIERDSETAVAPLPPEPPVASYSFDAGEGEIAHDESGNGHEGTVEGAQWVPGRFGSALRFDGEAEDCLTIPDSPQLQLTHEFTLEAWAKPEGDGPVIFKEAEHFVSYDLSIWGFKPEGAIAPHPYELTEIEGSEALPEGAWSQLALTYDGEYLRLYADGQLVGERETTGAVESEGPLRIGCNRDWEQDFSGLIDEVRIYDRTLTARQMAEDRNTPVSAETAESTRYEIERWKTTPETPISPPEDDPRLQVSYQSGLLSAVEGEQVPAQSYEHEGQMLTAHEDQAGEKAEYEYDEAKRLTGIKLPDGTTAEIEYEAAVGRVKAVTVQLAGKSAKTTRFEYQDEPRETTVHPQGEPVIHYQIGEDGSVFKWSNGLVPPEIEYLGGSLYVQRGEVHPATISPGDQNLEVKAYSPEGIASIQVIANGNQLVEEVTCDVEEPGNECSKPQSLEFVTETENWQPGILWLEVLVTDGIEQTESRRFWDNIPYTPPPEGEAPQPPTFEDIKHFREEFGLDLDLKGNKLAQNERIFELINAWHRPGTYLGEVARASWERWGVPLRPQDVADMEYRETYVPHDGELIEQWGEDSLPSEYAGYYVDNRDGGRIDVVFTGSAAANLNEMKSEVPLIEPMAAEAVEAPDAASLVRLTEVRESIIDAWSSRSELEGQIVGVEINPSKDRVEIAARDTAQVAAILSEVVGSAAPIELVQTSGELHPRRGLRAGDHLLNLNLISAEEVEERSCTAGPGAVERRPTTKPNGEPVVAEFVLTAGHCASIGAIVEAVGVPGQGGAGWLGKVRRTAYPGHEHYEEDAEAIRLERGWSAPRYFERAGRSALGIHEVGWSKPGETLCWSGYPRPGGVHCGEAAGVRMVELSTDEDPHHGRMWGIKIHKSSRDGESGSVIWDGRTKVIVGILDNEFEGYTYAAPLLRPHHAPVEKAPGVMNALDAAGGGEFRIARAP